AAVKNVAWFQTAPASRLTTASPAASSAITLIARGIEFGACTRNRASAAELMRADSLSIIVGCRRDCGLRNSDQTHAGVCNLRLCTLKISGNHTDAGATAGW